MIRFLRIIILLNILFTACTGSSPSLNPTDQPAPAEPVEAPAEEQEDLIARWHTPVAATIYPLLICQGTLPTISGEETGEAKALAALNVGRIANAGREVVANWDPGTEFEELKTSVLDSLDTLMSTSGEWYRDEINGEDYKDRLAELCTQIEAQVLETGKAARKEGLSQESLVQISEAIERSYREAAGP